MPADTYSPRIGLIEQGTGNNNNSWGTTFNNSFALIADRAIAGVNTITATGGTVDYSGSAPPAGPRQDVDAIQLANGALVSDLTIIVPNISKLWWFQNNTSGAFNMFVKTPGGTAPPNLVQIPQGLGVQVMCDGNGNLTRHDDSEIGSFQISGKASAGAGELACNGASLVRTEWPNLYAKISTTWGAADGTHFTLPNFTDTGRFLRSSSGTLTVGTYQSNQNAAHTHTFTGALTAGTLGTDSQGSHTHPDPGHTHGVTLAGPNGQPIALYTGGGSVDFPSGGVHVAVGLSVTINNATTGLGSAGAHVHNITGAPSIGTLANATQGGSEARPESAVALICIRY